jgi:hypothetical protein
MHPSHPRPHVLSAAAAASLLLHALLLLAIGRWYGSVQAPSTPRAVGSTIALVDIVPAPPVPSILRDFDSPTLSAETTPPAAPWETTGGADTAGSAVVPLAPAIGRPGSAAADLRGGFSDRRLHVQPRALRPEARDATLEESFRAALEAGDEAAARRKREDLARRQVALFGRKVTVFGDSSKVNWRNLTVILSGTRAVLPIDGREWEDLQMRKQNVDFVRDSILRARARKGRR